MEIRLAKTAGFCFGVNRAVELTYGLLNEGHKVATLGPLIHNPQAAGSAAVSETSPFAPASFSAGASSGVSVPAIFSISSRFLIITFLIPNALAISRNSARLFPSSAFRSCIVYFR